MMRFALLALTCISLFGQPPTFEIASVKPSPPEEQGGMIGPTPGGGLKARCMTLKNIIVWVYDIQNYQLSGGPSWLESDRWDIDAKADSSQIADDTPADFGKMNDVQRKKGMELVRLRLQSLLADRFQLTLHHESKEQTVYILNIAKNGPKLKDAGNTAGMLSRGRGRITSKGAQMDGLVRFLGIDLRRPVLDRTGLTGHYDYTLEWTPDSSPSSSETATGPSVFAAIQEQLGLRLDTQKAPVDVLVVDRAQRPSEN